jgi:Na+/phosphate symporter
VTALIIRPDSWNLPLLLHVGGAMALVASVSVAAVALIQGWRTSDPSAASLKRFGARTLLYAAIPSYFVMRIAAEWIASREHLENSNATWLGDGFIAADGGGILLLIATIVANVAVRRAPDSGLGKLAKVGAGLSLILVALYVFAVWAMTTKPS